MTQAQLFNSREDVVIIVPSFAHRDNGNGDVLDGVNFPNQRLVKNLIIEKNADNSLVVWTRSPHVSGGVH